MIDNSYFKEKIKEFNQKENRTDFFGLSQNLIKKDFEIEGMLLLLATWNFAGFRYAIIDFKVDEFRNIIKELQPIFAKFDNLDFKTINFDEYRNEIKTIYKKLSAIKGIEHTGTSKLMHLKCPNIFVMWDRYIRGEDTKKHYNELEVFKNNSFEIKRYSTTADGYIDFLKDMQNKFKHIDEQKTLVKVIDEFNYVTITLPILTMIKNEKNKNN